MLAQAMGIAGAIPVVPILAFSANHTAPIRVYMLGRSGYSNPASKGKCPLIPWENGRESTMAKASNASSTVAEFQSAVAEQIQRIEREREANRSIVAERLAQASIDAEVTPDESGGYKVTLKPNEMAGLPHGTKRSDFTAAALSEFDATYLKAEKERIWQWFRKMNTRGYHSHEQSRTALEALGYTTLPTPKTTVSFTGTTVIRHDSYGGPVFEHVSFTIPGEVSREAVEARLANHLQQPAVFTAVKAAFSDAEGLPEPVKNLYVTTEQSWPNHSEFHTESK